MSSLFVAGTASANQQGIDMVLGLYSEMVASENLNLPTPLPSTDLLSVEFKAVMERALDVNQSFPIFEAGVLSSGDDGRTWIQKYWYLPSGRGPNDSTINMKVLSCLPESVAGIVSGCQEELVNFELVSEGDSWKIDDIVYVGGADPTSLKKRLLIRLQ